MKQLWKSQTKSEDRRRKKERKEERKKERKRKNGTELWCQRTLSCPYEIHPCNVLYCTAVTATDEVTHNTTLLLATFKNRIWLTNKIIFLTARFSIFFLISSFGDRDPFSQIFSFFFIHYVLVLTSKHPSVLYNIVLPSYYRMNGSSVSINISLRYVTAIFTVK